MAKGKTSAASVREAKAAGGGARPPAKSIVLFSDGTGNSSSKLFKTNVWRMYEAVDLGPTPPDRRDQISYYDDGVGTSGFKPLAMLGGAFGWGLKRNVLDIYRYACRNYRPAPRQKKGVEPKGEQGDHIYGFGFSRGAFTMRIAIALIASQGLVVSTDERDLIRKSKDAYREFRKPFLPRKWTWPTRAARKVRDWIIDKTRGNRAPYDPAQNYRPVIRFVGVWDTVAAYGGPIAELTRAIDNWIFPLSMPSYGLDPRVRCARHALALDDERDAFLPLLWDEVHEKELIRKKQVSANRLEQVWFTGMHADVGGGYPDESLSYVSLLWMMEEAKACDLRTLRVIEDRFRALANGYGPMHDSRAGAGAYYRYQPRKISAWMQPVDPTIASLRDPIITDKRGRPKGLLYEAKIHESVVARIASGTDRYAPITLPQKIRIVPPQREGENAPQADSESSPAELALTLRRPMVTREQRARLENPRVSAKRAAAMEAVWDRVWRRRITYFVTVALTIALVSMPAWVEKMWPPPVLADGRTWIGGIIRLLTYALPGFAESWIDTYADNSFYFLVLVGAIAAMLVISTSMERRLRDYARVVWEQASKVAGPLPRVPPVSGLQRFRNDVKYQLRMQRFKWTILPNFVLWPVTLVLGLWLVAGLYTQARLPSLEAGNALCRKTPGPLEPLTARRLDFYPRNLCHRTGMAVTKGERYVVTFDVVDPWTDGSMPATPVGLSAGDMPNLRGYFGVPFRRVIDAGYLQPVIEIRPERRAWELFENVYIFPLQLVQQGGSGTVYRAEFVAPRNGEISIFSNDAVLPFVPPSIRGWDINYFYQRTGPEGRRGNGGSACVTIVRSDLAARVFRDTAAGVCGEADARSARATAEESLEAGSRKPPGSAIRPPPPPRPRR